MTYTKDQLKQQKIVATKQLERVRELQSEVLHPDWQKAIDYGEQVRVNWLRKLTQDQSFFEKKIMALTLEISEKD